MNSKRYYCCYYRECCYLVDDVSGLLPSRQLHSYIPMYIIMFLGFIREEEKKSKDKNKQLNTTTFREAKKKKKTRERHLYDSVHKRLNQLKS